MSDAAVKMICETIGAEYLFEEQKEAFFDAFVATRHRMYEKLVAA